MLRLCVQIRSRGKAVYLPNKRHSLIEQVCEKWELKLNRKYKWSKFRRYKLILSERYNFWSFKNILYCKNLRERMYVYEFWEKKKIVRSRLSDLYIFDGKVARDISRIWRMWEPTHYLLVTIWVWISYFPRIQLHARVIPCLICNIYKRMYPRIEGTKARLVHLYLRANMFLPINKRVFPLQTINFLKAQQLFNHGVK